MQSSGYQLTGPIFVPVLTLQSSSWMHAPRAPVTWVCWCGFYTLAGNFGLVGSSSGMVFKFNMQSGLPRGYYPTDPDTSPADWGGAKGACDRGAVFPIDMWRVACAM